MVIEWTEPSSVTGHLTVTPALGLLNSIEFQVALRVCDEIDRFLADDVPTSAPSTIVAPRSASQSFACFTINILRLCVRAQLLRTRTGINAPSFPRLRAPTEASSYLTSGSCCTPCGATLWRASVFRQGQNVRLTTHHSMERICYSTAVLEGRSVRW